MKGKYKVSVLIAVAIAVFLIMSAVPVMAKPSSVTVTLRDGTGHVVPNYYVGIYPLNGVQSYSAMVQTDTHGKAIVGVPSDWTSYNSVRVYVNPFSNDFSCYYYEPFALNKQYSGNIRITTCPAAKDSLCLDGCFDLQTNPDNCGTCGNTCSPSHADPLCDSGACSFASCDTGYGNCDHVNGNGCEANLNTNVLNCGTCGTICSPSNAIAECDGGACSFSSCDNGYENCDGNAQNGCETDITTVNNCGTCGNSCSFTNAGSSCTGGSCALGSCVTGYENCDDIPGNGCEQNVLTDTENCGSCGAACTVANGAPSCMGGVCYVYSCNVGYADCDGQYENGCEVNLDTDALNCGSCGNYCSRENVLTSSCNYGSCSIDSCAADYADCDEYAGDGCEADLNTDPGNCNSCGNVCSFDNAGASCTSGSCTLGSCNSPFDDCNTIPSDGCEVNLNRDTQNCGSCGTVCTVADGDPECWAGSCSVDICDPGYENCDGLYENGCEVNLNTDTQNCGECGNECLPSNADPSCEGGACSYTSCDTGYDNCDGNAQNGCETDITTDILNCGSCTNECPTDPNGDPSCTSGTCGIDCDSGYDFCTAFSGSSAEIGPASTVGGCVNLDTDTQNCGSCGNECMVANGGASCDGGSCSVASCDSGYADCDGLYENGCEADLNNDLLHCGTCGIACSTNNGSASCTSGTCGITCDSGYGDCNDNAADGCESDFSKDDQHCGSCGNSCVGLSCVGGSCQT